MKARPGNAESGGFTLIELMVALAIMAVLVMLAAPSFNAFFAKKRVEGLMSELQTDIQYARSEAAQRNVPVQLTLGTNCYVIHALPAAATAASSVTACTQAEGSASTLGPDETELKTAKVAIGSSVSLSPTSGTIVFDPVRGMADISAGAQAVTATSSIGEWNLRANISAIGRATLCSPAGTGNIGGYAAC